MNQNEKLVFLLLLVLVTVVTVMQFQTNLLINGDNVFYLKLGESILDGNYSYNSTSYEIVPHTKFPFGLPLIIALSGIFSSDIIISGKIAVVILHILSVALLFIIMRRIYSTTISFFTALFFGINSHMIQYSSAVMTEVPASFFILLSIYFYILHQEKEPNTEAYKSKFLIFSIAALVYTYFIRTSQIAMIGGMLTLLFFDAIKIKKFRKLIFSILTVFIFILPWQLRNMAIGSGSGYLKEFLLVNYHRPELGYIDFSKFIERVSDNFSKYFFSENPSAFFTNYNLGEVPFILELLAFILIILGIIQIYKKPKYRIIVYFFLFHTFIMLVWISVASGIRYFIPVISLMIFFMVAGLEFLFKNIKPGFENYFKFSISFIILLLFLNFTGLKRNKEQYVKAYPPNWQNFYLSNIWLKDYIKKEDSSNKEVYIASTKTEFTNLWTGYAAKAYTTGKKPNPQEVLDLLKQQKTDYVILDQLGFSRVYRYLWPTIQAFPANFKVIHKLTNPDTYVLKFIP